MEKQEEAYINIEYPEAKEKVVTLNIEHKYRRDDPALRRILREKLAKYIQNEGLNS